MRKNILIILCLVFCLCLAGCAVDDGNSSQNDNPASPTDVVIEPSAYFESGFTEENIRTFYADQQIELAYININQDDRLEIDLALVAYQEGAGLEWYEFETIDIGANRAQAFSNFWLPQEVTFAGYTGLDIVANTFWDDAGPYNEDEFPTHISLDASDMAYHRLERPYFASLAESYTVGRANHVKLNAIRFTTNGLDIEFGCPTEDNVGYYAGGVKRAQAHFSFDQGASTGTIVLKNTELGTAYSSLNNEENIDIVPVKSFSITEDGEDLIITLNLNEEVEYYNVVYDSSLMHDGFYSVTFSSNGR